MSDKRARGRGHLLGCMALAGAVVLAGVSAAHALTTPQCLAKKLKEWGTLRKCQAVENGKALQGKPANPAKCQTTFDTKLAKLSAQAAAAAIVCRYGDNGDDTVTDYDTGLQWEKKLAGGPLHRTVYGAPTWYDAMNDIVSAMNEWTIVINPQKPGLAGYNDWRLPSIDELRGILRTPCGTPPCIDPIFGPTESFGYWSATTHAELPSYAWYVDFNSGLVTYYLKTYTYYVRAVRGAL